MIKLNFDYEVHCPHCTSTKVQYNRTVIDWLDTHSHIVHDVECLACEHQYQVTQDAEYGTEDRNEVHDG